MYHNVPTPLARKLAGVTRLFARQVSLLDVLTLLGGAIASGVVGGIALAWDGLKRWGRPRTNVTVVGAYVDMSTLVIAVLYMQTPA